MKRNKLIIFILLFITIILLFVFLCFLNNSKINYSSFNGKNWNKKVKENKKIIDNNMKNLKIENKLDSGQTVFFYTGKKWVEYNEKYNSNIYGIKIINSRKFLDKYSICYRTYNNKNKWLNWTCSDELDIVSGNKKEKISGIQFKIIELDSNKYDYLEDLYENSNKKNYNF